MAEPIPSVVKNALDALKSKSEAQTPNSKE